MLFELKHIKCARMRVYFILGRGYYFIYTLMKITINKNFIMFVDVSPERVAFDILAMEM
jgi:hypothetical protein